MSRSVILTGVGRSGTSLIASLLKKGGVNIGEKLLAANHHNPRGFFEDMDFLEFHERALQKRGQTFLAGRNFAFVPTSEEAEKAAALIKQREGNELWGWKDPRTSLFLDFWQQLLPDARFVFVYRHPLDVLLSLVRQKNYYGLGLLEGLEAWFVYNSRIKEFCERHPDKTLLCHTYSVINGIDEFRELLRGKLELKIDLDGSALDSLYHSADLRRVSLTPDIRAMLRSIHEESLDLYEELNSMADIPDVSPTLSLPEKAETEEREELFPIAQMALALLGKDNDATRRGLLLLLLSSIAPELIKNFFAGYVKYLSEVEIGNAWLTEQWENWQKLAEEREGTIQEQRAWILELEKAKAWLDEQRENWQKLAEEREGTIQEQRAWILELEKAKAWLDEQRENWQKLAEERQGIIQG